MLIPVLACLVTKSRCCRSTAPLEPLHLSPGPRGSLSSLAPVPVLGLETPGVSHVALSVQAVGLNFRCCHCSTLTRTLRSSRTHGATLNLRCAAGTCSTCWACTLEIQARLAAT